MPNIQLAKNLRALREASHLTQTALGTQLNISRQAYSNYENGKRTPDLDMLYRLSRIYHVTIDELVIQNLQNRIRDEKTPYLAACSDCSGNSLYLTDEELQMVLKYRDLSPEDKIIMDSFLEMHTKGK